MRMIQKQGIMHSHISSLSKLNILLGNLFVHYDSALFTLLSPFFAQIFFPNYDQLTALILTYGIIPLGMLARPIGSLVFGYIGDNYGRKEALVGALFGIGVVTGCIGFLPTYERVGMLAPILLLVGRICQNFFGAGESMGGAIFYLKNLQNLTKILSVVFLQHLRWQAS